MQLSFVTKSRGQQLQSRRGALMVLSKTQLIFLLRHLQRLAFGLRLIAHPSYCCIKGFDHGTPIKVSGRKGWGQKAFTPLKVCLINEVDPQISPDLSLAESWIMCPFWANHCWRRMLHFYLRWVITYLLGLEINPPSKDQGISTP